MNTPIKSAAEFYRRANGQSVTRTVVGGVTIEDWDQFITNVKTKAKEAGMKESDVEVEDNKITVVPTGQVWLKPKTPRVMQGTMVVRSRDFYFESDQFEGDQNRSYADKKGLSIVDNKLVLKTFVGSEIHYSIN